MLNITGAFVVYGPGMAPMPVLLGAGAYALYCERVRLVGPEQAARATFGNEAAYALPCTVDCMEWVALQYTGPHADALRALCARIALKQPFNPEPNESDGGAGVKAEKKQPRKPRPGGAAVAIPQTATV